MKKRILYPAAVLILLGVGLWSALHVAQQAADRKLAAQEAQTQTVSAAEETELAAAAPPQTLPPTTSPTEPITETAVPYVLTFTEEEETLLLKIGMAERGDIGCTECIALVMRTVLNRVDSPRFSSSVRGVIYARDQFTPVAEGTFETAVPNDRCREALDMVKRGWDESRGALYYEWCEGESWHSKNLNLLFQHCDTRFYN